MPQAALGQPMSSRAAERAFFTTAVSGLWTGDLLRDVVLLKDGRVARILHDFCSMSGLGSVSASLLAAPRRDAPCRSRAEYKRFHLGVVAGVVGGVVFCAEAGWAALEAASVVADPEDVALPLLCAFGVFSASSEESEQGDPEEPAVAEPPSVVVVLCSVGLC